MMFSSPRNLMTLGLISGMAVTPMLTAQAAEPIRMATFPELSPDGSRILFAWKGDIWTALAEGGKASRLTTHPANDFAPRFTPDGQSICFGSTREGGYQIFQMPAQGGKAKQITFHTEGSFLEDIAPDGKSLLIRGVRDFTGRKPYRLYHINLQGNSKEKMVFPAYAENGRFSHDGKSIIFTREGAQTYRKGYYGTQASQVWTWNAQGNDSFQQPVSNEYGCRTPLYHGQEGNFFYTLGSTNGFNLWHHDAASDINQQVTRFEDDSVLQPAIADNGSAIIFRHLFDLYLLPLSAGKVTDAKPQKLNLWHEEDLEEKSHEDRAIKTTSDLSFSPSGLEIVFVAEGDLWAMDTILRKPNRLTNTPGHENDVWFSHDGKSIFYVYDNGIDKEIRRLSKTKDEQFWWDAEEFKHTLIIPASERPLHIIPGPKGKQIAYTTYPGNLWLSKPDGSDRTRLLESWSAPSVQWSPDGKWLAYSTQDNNFNPDVFIISTDGQSAPVNISLHPDVDFSPVWSPNGRRIAFVGRHHKENYDIFYLDLYKSDAIKDKDGETRDKARKAMQKDPAYQKKKPAKKTKPDAKEVVKKAIKNLTGKQKEKKEDKKKAKKKEPETFALEHVHQRLQRLQVKGTSPSRLIWSHDSKRILFQSRTRGSKTIYAIEAKSSAKPAKYADGTGTPIRMDKSGKLYMLSDGLPAVLSKGKIAKYPFTIYTERDSFPMETHGLSHRLEHHEG